MRNKDTFKIIFISINLHRHRFSYTVAMTTRHFRKHRHACRFK